jgi:hypothetical protein
MLVGRTRTRVKAILGSPDVTYGRTWADVDIRADAENRIIPA